MKIHIKNPITIIIIIHIYGEVYITIYRERARYSRRL